MLFSSCGAGNDTSAPPAAPTGRPNPVANDAAPPTTDPTQLTLNTVPLELYQHPEQGFSIRHPGNWQAFERPDGIVFIDPTGQAAYGVIVVEAARTLSDEEQASFLNQFVAENFAAEEGFTPMAQNDSDITFNSTDPNLGPSTNRIGLISQSAAAGTKLYLTQMTIVDAEWARAAPVLQTYLQTLIPASPNVQATPPTPAGPPTWELFTHPTERLAFLYPSTWKVVAREQIITATEVSQAYVFNLHIMPLTETIAALNLDPATDPVALSVTYIDAETAILAEQHANLETRPAEPYLTDGAAGTSIDYLYINADGQPVAGSLIATPLEDRLLRITLEAPAEQYSAALLWFNPMLQSFRVLPADMFNEGP